MRILSCEWNEYHFNVSPLFTKLWFMHNYEEKKNVIKPFNSLSNILQFF